MERHFLGFDSMKNQERQSMIKKSQFYMDLVKDLSSNTRLEKLEIKELKFGVDQTRLFDDKFVQWGILKV